MWQLKITDPEFGILAILGRTDSEKFAALYRRPLLRLGGSSWTEPLVFLTRPWRTLPLGYPLCLGRFSTQEMEKVQVVSEDSIDTFCNISLKMLNHGPDEGPRELMAKTLVFFFLFIFLKAHTMPTELFELCESTVIFLSACLYRLCGLNDARTNPLLFCYCFCRHLPWISSGTMFTKPNKMILKSIKNFLLLGNIPGSLHVLAQRIDRIL